MPKNDFDPGSSTIDGFFGFINERHQVWLNRERKQDPPWTEDPVLQKFKFTNVFRQLDRGTMWLQQEIIEKVVITEDTLPEDRENCLDLLFFNIVSYRMYNLASAQKRLGFISHWPNSRRRWLGLTSPVFTSAHMTVGQKGESKQDTYALVWDELWELRRDLRTHIQDSTTLEEAFDRLQRYNVFGVGPFIGYEIVSDLRWTMIGRHWTDRLSWANIGPGCRRGLLRLGLPVNQHSMRRLYGLARGKLSPTLRSHWDAAESDLRVGGTHATTIPTERPTGGYMASPVASVVGAWRHPAGYGLGLVYPPFEMREIEHCLCEFDKYERAASGLGRPKQRFQPEGS